MNKQIARKLDDKAYEIAQKFSNSDRAYNFNNEAFEVKQIKPLSERVAAVFFKKTSGKVAMAVLYYLKNPDDGYWQYFFPTESHIYGFRRIQELLEKVEEHNFKFNFE